MPRYSFTPKPVKTEQGKRLILRPYRWKTDYPEVLVNMKISKVYDETWDTEESLKLMSEQDTNLIIVAETRSRLHPEIVGSIFATTAGHYAFVWRLNVLPSRRLEGISQMLLESVQEFLRERGIPEVALFADVKRDDLQSYYKHLRWQTSGNAFRCWWKKTGAKQHA